VDHIASTAGFTLQHLEYLVIDETDRLLSQSYQDWLPRVLAAAHKEGVRRGPEEGGREGGCAGAALEGGGLAGVAVDAVTLRSLSAHGSLRTYTAAETQTPLRKMLFSATLTRHPHKVASLRLQVRS
jgi:ATP-dependent RNA helicase DDX51/DBP6